MKTWNIVMLCLTDGEKSNILEDKNDQLKLTKDDEVFRREHGKHLSCDS